MSERLYHEAVGRRKESTARARIFPDGAGDFIVNDKEVQQYFPRIGDIDKVRSPMLLTQLLDSVDISIHVSGGGVTGQVDATAHAISRALLKFDPETLSTLRGAGLLTRDARVKERKKPGLKRARKAPTYTKR
jgi:small subunit ribosomal protein S9